MDYERLYFNLIGKDELIKEFELKVSRVGVVNKWGGKRYMFNIYVNGKCFEYYDSIHNFEQGKKTLSKDDKLFAFRCIISDALSYKEYSKDIEGFLRDFGYIDSDINIDFGTLCKYGEEVLTLEQLERFKEGTRAYRGCERSYFKLNLLSEDLYQILENLNEMGIE